MRPHDDHGDHDDSEPEDTPLFEIRNYIRFVKGALRRHRWLAVIVFLVNVAAALAILYSWPKTYHVEAKVLAHANAALTERGDAPGGEAPTRTAAETILRHDALVELVKQHDLIRYQATHRAPAERARDAIAKLLSSQPDTDQDRMDAMVDLLEKRLNVWTNQDGNTVSIAIDWPDAQMAVRIVDSAQQNYLESRHAQEVTALSEAIGILQSHAANLQANVDDAVAALRKVRADKGGQPSADAVDNVVTRATPPVQRPAAPRVDPAQMQIKASIEAKQRAIADLEDFRHRHLSDLQAKLAEEQAIYTENHPAVVDLKQAIASASGESPQVKTLRSEIATLKESAPSTVPADLPPLPVRAAAAVEETTPKAAAFSESLSAPSSSEGSASLMDLREERDPNVLYARGRLRDAMEKNAALAAQIQTTQIDLETAEAAFKYRYAIVMPAHVPRKPVKPNVPLLTFAAVLAGLLIATFLAVVADLRTGRLVEIWQLERLLARPIIADIQLRHIPETELK